MAEIRLKKLIVIVLLCLAMSVLLGVQALSSITTRKAPDQSVNLFPFNGLALEQLAFRNFRAAVAESGSIEGASLQTLPTARRGLEHDPLAPKSYALLAMAERDPSRKSEILDFASKLNRRDISLQGLVLQNHLGANDYRGAIDTLDQILRVHPDYSDEFFPVLNEALKIEEAAPLFPDILNGSSPWHIQFLFFAVQDKEVQLNLAEIRSQIPIENAVFDKQLIERLALQGQLELARNLYERRLETDATDLESRESDWPSEFPPFDWSLEQQRDFRSQPTRDGKSLELYARSGQGGAIARRVITTLQAPFEIRTNLEMRATGRSDAVRLVLRCGGQQEPTLDEAIVPGDNAFAVENLPAGCDQAIIEIRARALRGEPTLRAELSAIKIEPI